MSPENRIRDAAIVLNSLPADMVSNMLGRLDEQSRDQLMDSMDSLEEISGRELHRISRRFRDDAFCSSDAIEPSGIDALLWPKDSLGPNTGAFSFLKYMDSEPRRRLLEAEHPVNVAMVLSTLEPEFASTITSELDLSFRTSVIRRLCELDDVDDARLMELRYLLRMRAKRILAIDNCTRRGISVAADLLSLSDQQTRESVIAWLADRDGELGDELQQRVLTMNDLNEFSDEQIVNLLKVVDTSAWAGALRSSLPSVANRVLGMMVPRAAKIVSAEMAAFNPLNEQAMQWSVEQVISAAMKIRQAD